VLGDLDAHRARLVVAGRDVAARAQPRQLEQPPSGPHLLARHARADEPVLGDRVAGVLAFEQPAGQLRAARVERMHPRRGDHEQRQAVDAVVGQPVADQRAALERRGLDVVERNGDLFCSFVTVRKPCGDQPVNAPGDVRPTP